MGLSFRWNRRSGESEAGGDHRVSVPDGRPSIHAGSPAVDLVTWLAAVREGDQSPPFVTQAHFLRALARENLTLRQRVSDLERRMSA